MIWWWAYIFPSPQYERGTHQLLTALKSATNGFFQPFYYDRLLLQSSISVVQTYTHSPKARLQSTSANPVPKRLVIQYNLDLTSLRPRQAEPINIAFLQALLQTQTLRSWYPVQFQHIWISNSLRHLLTDASGIHQVLTQASTRPQLLTGAYTRFSKYEPLQRFS